MYLKTLASGSSGNCTLVGTHGAALLIDAGISAKRIEDSLKESQVDADSLSGILLTHEHIDHVTGLRVFLKHHPVPVYASRGTIHSILHNEREVDRHLFHEIAPESSFQTGPFEVRSFPVSHDAAEPFSYRITSGNKSAALMTDLGLFTPAHTAFLKGVNALVLEANHDIRMLEAGSYPYALKRRILSDFGHLSNENAGKLLLSVMHPDLKVCVLAHLSEENNLPELALLSVKNEIDLGEGTYSSSDLLIEAAPRDTMSKKYEF